MCPTTPFGKTSCRHQSAIIIRSCVFTLFYFIGWETRVVYILWTCSCAKSSCNGAQTRKVPYTYTVHGAEWLYTGRNANCITREEAATQKQGRIYLVRLCQMYSEKCVALNNTKHTNDCAKTIKVCLWKNKARQDTRTANRRIPFAFVVGVQVGDVTRHPYYLITVTMQVPGEGKSDRYIQQKTTQKLQWKERKRERDENGRSARCSSQYICENGKRR